MMQSKKKIPAPIPLFCYAVAILLWLVTSLYHLGADVLAKQTGKLYEQQLTVDSFELVNMHKQEDGTYLTENDDPQMIWYNTEGIAVRTLRMTASFDRSPREMCLYYTTKEGEDFGVNNRVFASQQDDGSYVYTLPQGTITALRLDPCSPLENKPVTMTIEQFVLNQPAGVLSYFAPGWAGAFHLVVYPGLCAAALSLMRQAVLYYKRKK